MSLVWAWSSTDCPAPALHFITPVLPLTGSSSHSIMSFLCVSQRPAQHQALKFLRKNTKAKFKAIKPTPCCLLSSFLVNLSPAGDLEAHGREGSNVCLASVFHLAAQVCFFPFHSTVWKIHEPAPSSVCWPHDDPLSGEATPGHRSSDTVFSEPQVGTSPSKKTI